MRTHSNIVPLKTYQGRRLIEPVSVSDFLEMDIPPRPTLLDPWLVEPSLAMIHAWRGVGKTNFALEVAWAVASGGQFLMWTAPKSRQVLYVDGELPMQELHARLRRISGRQCGDACPPRLNLISPGLLDEQRMPDLGTDEGQHVISDALGNDTKLLILDNISTLVRSGAENESGSWASIQDWLIWLRSEGVTVLLIHHTGKKGAQRGTSKREDILDVVLHLNHPKNYRPSDGARFTVEFEKARFLYGEAVMPFECRLRTPKRHTDGRPCLTRSAWTWTSPDEE